MKNFINKYIKKLKIEYSGIAEYKGKSYLICLFPYYVENSKGNIAKYARSGDYHKIVKQYLENISAFLEKINIKTGGIYCDSNALPERWLAKEAGLGFIGKNSCLINEKYGSFVFIGVIELLEHLEKDGPLNVSCTNCNKCINICPMQALNKGFEKERCLSNISQDKSSFTKEEAKILKKAGKIFGCDICQDICPFNENPQKTPIMEFYENRINSITEKNWTNNRDFRNKYGGYAFAWRGAKVIERNIENLKGKCE